MCWVDNGATAKPGYYGTLGSSVGFWYIEVSDIIRNVLIITLVVIYSVNNRKKSSILDSKDINIYKNNKILN